MPVHVPVAARDFHGARAVVSVVLAEISSLVKKEAVAPSMRRLPESCITIAFERVREKFESTLRIIHRLLQTYVVLVFFKLISTRRKFF